MKKSRKNELATYLNLFTKCKYAADIKFIIFGQSRIGSTLLGDLMNSHPSIFCDKEIWSRRYVEKMWFPFYYTKGCSYKENKDVYGFNLKWNQVREQNVNPKHFFLRLHKKGWKIILLQRLNPLDQALSSLIAKKRRKWHDKSPNALTDLYFKLDGQEIIKLIKKIEATKKQEIEILRNIPHLKLTYEGHLLYPENHQNTLHEIFNYLGVSSVPVKTKFYKISPHNKKEYIENYDEIIQIIRSSEYAYLLE